MKKLLIKLFIAGLTFYLGLITFDCLDISTLPKVIAPVNLDTFYIASPVTVCELDDNPDKYDGEIVETFATIYAVDSENILYPMNCFCQGDIHFSFLELTEKNSTQHYLFEALRNDKPFKKEIDVRIVGEVVKFKHKDLGNSYLIIPKKIEIISPFRKFTPKGAA